MLGFWSGSSQSIEVYITQSTRRLFAEYKNAEISEFSGVLPFYLLSKLFQWLIMQENMDKADLSIIKRGKLCQISAWINGFSHLTSVSLVRWNKFMQLAEIHAYKKIANVSVGLQRWKAISFAFFCASALQLGGNLHARSCWTNVYNLNICLREGM